MGNSKRQFKNVGFNSNDNKRLRRTDSDSDYFPMATPVYVRSDTEDEEDILNKEILNLKIQLNKKYKKLNDLRIRKAVKSKEVEIRNQLRNETKVYLPSLQSVAKSVEKAKNNEKSIVKEILNNISLNNENDDNSSDDEFDNVLKNFSSDTILKSLIDNNDNLNDID